MYATRSSRSRSKKSFHEIPDLAAERGLLFITMVFAYVSSTIFPLTAAVRTSLTMLVSAFQTKNIFWFGPAQAIGGTSEDTFIDEHFVMDFRE